MSRREIQEKGKLIDALNKTIDTRYIKKLNGYHNIIIGDDIGKISNKQRKGQYLINHIRSDPKFQKLSLIEQWKIIENTIWNMTNEEFDNIMKEY